MTTNDVGAEAAMLELERYTRECEKLGSRDIKFHQHYAAIYSRLYLVNKKLGRDQTADQYYQKAIEYWEREFARRGLPAPTPQEMCEQVEGVDRYLGEPQWQANP
ncbi:MAG: hypothetical protein IH623_25475 [Verrucomicrobia bacterium]|nr:hypothetical protein [Verrucomicrobiota bacterium]